MRKSVVLPIKKLHIGDILLTSTRHIISKVIEWWTISRWSHVGVYVGDGLVIEATFPRVRKVPVSTFLKGCTEVCVLRHIQWDTLEDVQRKSFLEFLESKVGKPYDIRGLLSFVCRRSIQNKSGYFCSELVSEAFSSIGIPIERKRPSWTTPEDIHSSLILDVVMVRRI